MTEEWVCGYCETGAHERCTGGSQALIDGITEWCVCQHEEVDE